MRRVALIDRQATQLLIIAIDNKIGRVILSYCRPITSNNRDNAER